MKLLFWLTFALIAYAYAGYPLLLAVFAGRRPIRRSDWTPTVSILIAARNEERTLPAKLASLRELAYPSDRMETIVVSDGSTDRTAEIAEAAGAGVIAVGLPKSVGKAEALNRAAARATGEILVFLDARQRVDSCAIRELVSCLGDPGVGAVSGELLLETEAGEPSPDGLGIYWKIEKLTRRLESETGSVVGVTGAIYGLRRELYRAVPPGTLLDDVLIPMQVARAGFRVLFHPGAIARDCLFLDPGKEFSRKVRTLTGNYQLLRLAPWLLSPANPLLFRLISHKLLRLAVPLLLLVLLAASVAVSGVFYRCALVAQLLFYAVALFGLVAPPSRRVRAVSVPYTFAMLNVAAAVAFYNFLGGRTRWA